MHKWCSSEISTISHVTEEAHVLIPPAELQRYWKLKPSVILHIGAHEAEEITQYVELGWGTARVVWVEALEDKANVVKDRTCHLPNHEVINIVAWDASGDTVTFHETINGQSSSALELGAHADLYPEIVVTRSSERITHRIEDAVDFSSTAYIDLVNLDIQGAELKALKGLGDQINKVQAIYCEVNTAELYVGCAQLPELDEWLKTQGFTRVDWEILPEHWGDALWIRSTRLPRNIGYRRTLRRLHSGVRGSTNRVRGLIGPQLRRLGLRR